MDGRVTITLWRLATNIEYRTLGNLFGVGRSTAGTVTLETCHAIQEMMPKYVCLHVGEEVKQNLKHNLRSVGVFHKLWVRLTVHTSLLFVHLVKVHLIITTKKVLFYCKAVVDFSGHFMDVYIGWSGKVHDACVLANFMQKVKQEHYSQIGHGN